MQNFMKTILNGVRKWTKTEIKGAIKDSTADWNQNNPNADNYVKNRTHWEEKPATILVNNLTSEEYANGRFPRCTFTPGEKYTVIWNGVTYENLPCYRDDSYNVIATEDDRIPFYIDDDGGNGLYIQPNDSNEYWTTTILIPGIIHKLDAKYLDMPTNLATTDDIEVKANQLLEVTNQVTNQLVEFKKNKLLTLPVINRWNSIAYGNGKFVAVSDFSSNNEIIYSKDGIVWNHSTFPIYGLWRIAYGAGIFVAINLTKNTYCYSEDGINWTSSTLPGYLSFSSIVYGNGKFVIASDGKVFYSEDGIDWSSSPIPITSSHLHIAYGNGRFVIAEGATKYDRSIIYSDDGINWTVGQTHKGISSLVYGNGMFIAATYGEKTEIYSYDGINWTNASNPFTYADLCYANKKFFSYYDDDGVYCSKDGINWIALTISGTIHPNNIIYHGGKFIIIDGAHNEKILYSKDCVNWYDTYDFLYQNNEDKTQEIKELILDGVNYIPTPEDATVGQTIVVKSIDENGKPTEWEAVDMVRGIPDYTSADEGKFLRIVNGVPAWVSIPNAEEASF